MEEYKNLEEIIELCEEELNNNDENVTAILDLTDLKELRNLIKTYKELEVITNGIKVLETNRVNDDTFYVIAKTDFLKGSYKHLLDDYIPKSKVKEKIEEIKMTSSQINGDYFMNNYKIEVLQELLEE